MKRLLALLAACGGNAAAGDGGVDAITDVAADAPQCFGTIESYCFAAPPAGTLVIAGGIDTTLCEPAIDDRCVIAARDIVVSGFISVAKRPIVLVAARSLQIDGVLTANGNTSNADCPALAAPGQTGGGAGGTLGTKAGSGANGGLRFRHRGEQPAGVDHAARRLQRQRPHRRRARWRWHRVDRRRADLDPRGLARRRVRHRRRWRRCCRIAGRPGLGRVARAG